MIELEDKAMANIMKNHAMMQPDPAFSANLVRQLHAKKSKSVARLSPGVWITIAAFAAIILIALILVPDSGSTNTPLSVALSRFFSNSFNLLNSRLMNTTLILTFGISVLITLDQWFHRSKKLPVQV